MKHYMAMTVWMMMAALLQAAPLPDQPLQGTMTSIDGEPVDLAGYHGKVVMVVNVASRCGFTRQYKQLQEIHTRFDDRGFTVLGFPCNQFGGQEPGTAADIKSFCTARFGVTFPMFSKVDVNGEQAAPLYQYLTSTKTPINDQGPVKWNFEKFLFNRNGQLIARYRSKVAPDAPQVIKTIEQALAEDPAAGQP